ncbi:MAG: hypothetical protein H6608_00630 [Flavobacteriales bacterium]|nr:hypothetical protein [Bacteroidota bacterium]MCB9239611.1 hypothetical protein [Flavobacteriales bacterium]
MSNCVEPDEVQTSIHSARDNSDAETQYFSAYDVLYDVISTNGKLLKAETTILPSSAIITYTDTTFDDGDGIEFSVDFGPLGVEVPKGVLCQDGRYRSGKLNIRANTKFDDPKMKVEMIISEDDQFFTGNGSEMNQLTGTTTVHRAGLLSLGIDIKDARILTPEYTLTWNSTRIVKLMEDNGPGIWGDKYKLTGSATGTNRFNEAYTVTIDEPLVKKMEAGCARTFVAGKLTITGTASEPAISIDYDPYDNQACDAQAEAEINGRKTIFSVR